jgi:hypothetical protein
MGASSRTRGGCLTKERLAKAIIIAADMIKIGNVRFPDIERGR